MDERTPPVVRGVERVEQRGVVRIALPPAVRRPQDGLLSQVLHGEPLDVGPRLLVGHHVARVGSLLMAPLPFLPGVGGRDYFFIHYYQILFKYLLVFLS